MTSAFTIAGAKQFLKRDARRRGVAQLRLDLGEPLPLRKRLDTLRSVAQRPWKKRCKSSKVSLPIPRIFSILDQSGHSAGVARSFGVGEVGGSNPTGPIQ